MTQPSQDDRAALQDVKQLGLWAGIASLGYVFWVVGGMEMVERLAYFGVRSVSMLYVILDRSINRNRHHVGRLHVASQ